MELQKIIILITYLKTYFTYFLFYGHDFLECTYQKLQFKNKKTKTKMNITGVKTTTVVYKF